MRVLWIATPACNYIPKGYSDKGYNGGGWISSLQSEVAKDGDIQLGIAFCKDGEPWKVDQKGVTYYIVPNHRKPFKDKILDVWHSQDPRRDEVLWPYYKSQFQKIIEDFQPDVIEIFGSELYQQLAAHVVGSIPTVLHIQGLLSLSIYILLPPGLSKWRFIRSGNGIRGKFAHYQYLCYWRRSVWREKSILRSVSHVIGRTAWDRQALAELNPKAEYHYGGEILRDVFYQECQREIPARPVIVSTISGAPYKGYDVILKVADILKNELHMDFEWKVFGITDPLLMEKITGIRHDDVSVQLCGVAPADTIHDALLHCTLYVHPSYIENSPNSVCEAQLTGIPVVASRVGGTASLVEHGKTGYLYPVTDPFMAAYYINRLVSDRQENILMGKASRKEALVRHDKGTIASALIELYRKMSR